MRDEQRVLLGIHGGKYGFRDACICNIILK
jgi:hypothetical protein